MNKGPLFSTYRQGENRVTASMLAVFERIDLAAVERLLQAASGESSLELVRFENQVQAPRTVPDASISASFRYLFEVKTERGTVERIQLDGHVEGFGGRFMDERLFVVTPDDEQPSIIDELGNDRVTWFSFRALSDAIDELLTDAAAQLSDREAFLLRELQHLFEADGLFNLPEDVVVVAARQAYPFYAVHHAYRCQAGRSFRDGLKYLGFYTEKAIRPEVAAILGRFDRVVVSEQSAAVYASDENPIAQRVADVIRASLAEDPELRDWESQIFILSGPGDDETLLLDVPIAHEQKGAWTQGQRYVTSDMLKIARTTDDLAAV
ncbi:MAG: hypothetical protein V3S31_06670 [Dehalococcoidia bacterium]